MRHDNLVKIQELLREFRVDFVSAGEHHHARPGWIAIKSCPFCGSSRFHLGYHLESGFFTCWKCKGHGVISTLTKLGVPFKQAESFYRGRSIVLSRKEREARGQLKEPKGRGPLLKIHKEYLESRGFNPEELVEHWELEGIGRAGGRLAWRVYIPIAFRGERVSWTTRTVGEAGQRYLSASAQEESLNHKTLVYGLDLARQSIIGVEGPADAWNVGPGAGCLFGIDFSPSQVLLLSQFPRRIICFDSSPDAQLRAGNLCDELSLFPGHTEKVELDAEDPGKASRKEIKLLRKIAKLT